MVPISEAASERPFALVIAASARYLVSSAINAGYQVAAIDQFGDSDLKQAVEFWLPLEHSGWHDAIDRVCAHFQEFNHGNRNSGVIVCGGGFENNLQALRGITDRCTSFGLEPRFAAPAVVQAVRDVQTMDQVVTSAGFQTPPRMQWKAVEKAGPTTWLVKPKSGSAGLGIKKYPPGPKPLHAPTIDHYLQQRIPGRAIGATLLLGPKTARVVGYTRGLTLSIDELPFLYAGSIGPVQVHPVTQTAMGRLAIRLSAIGLRGLVGVDFVEPVGDQTGSPPWFLEVNPRPTASMEVLERSFQCSLFSAHLDCFHSEKPNSEPHESVDGDPDFPAETPAGNTAKLIFWSGRALRFDRDILRRLQQDVPISNDHCEWCDIPDPGHEIPAVSPMATLVMNNVSQQQLIRARKLQLHFARR